MGIGRSSLPLKVVLSLTVVYVFSVPDDPGPRRLNVKTARLFLLIVLSSGLPNHMGQLFRSRGNDTTMANRRS